MVKFLNLTTFWTNHPLCPYRHLCHAMPYPKSPPITHWFNFPCYQFVTSSCIGFVPACFQTWTDQNTSTNRKIDEMCKQQHESLSLSLAFQCNLITCYYCYFAFHQHLISICHVHTNLGVILLKYGLNYTMFPSFVEFCCNEDAWNVSFMKRL